MLNHIESFAYFVDPQIRKWPSRKNVIVPPVEQNKTVQIRTQEPRHCSLSYNFQTTTLGLRLCLMRSLVSTLKSALDFVDLLSYNHSVPKAMFKLVERSSNSGKPIARRCSNAKVGHYIPILERPLSHQDISRRIVYLPKSVLHTFSIAF